MNNIMKAIVVILVVSFVAMSTQCASTQQAKKPISSESSTKRAPAVLTKIYFKNNKVIHCDMVWEGYEGQILCKQSEDIVAYSAGGVDLVKTFGEKVAPEIAARYEKVKHREESKKILRSLHTGSGSSGGSSYTYKDIVISNFTIRQDDKASSYMKCSFGIKNSGYPSNVTLGIIGISWDGYVLSKQYVRVYKLWRGEFRNISKILLVGSSKIKIISRWKLDRVSVRKYTMVGDKYSE